MSFTLVFTIRKPSFSVACLVSVSAPDYHYPGKACIGGSVNLLQTLTMLIAMLGNDTPLHVAVLFVQDQIALTLINDFGCDTTITGGLGRSLLHKACQGGSVSLVRALILEHNADINAKDNKGQTPLHVAAFCGQDEVALNLIDEFGCDTTVTGGLGRSLLHSACCGGSVNLVRTLLLEHNANVDANDDKNDTPLHVAAWSGHDRVALTLINELGCDNRHRWLKQIFAAQRM